MGWQMEVVESRMFTANVKGTIHSLPLQTRSSYVPLCLWPAVGSVLVTSKPIFLWKRKTVYVKCKADKCWLLRWCLSLRQHGWLCVSTTKSVSHVDNATDRNAAV